MNTDKHVHATGNTLQIEQFPLNLTDEPVCGALNSIVFSLVNFDTRGVAYININQFFMYTDPGSMDELKYQAFSLAKRLSIPYGMDLEEAMDILEDIYDSEPVA